MRFFFVPLAVLALLAASPHSSLAQTQREMNMEAGKKLEKADAQMNKVYKQILAQRTGEPEFIAVLKEGQRAWLTFMELHMKMLFFVKEEESPREVYGSVYPTEFADAKTSLIEARVKQLRELLLE